MIKKTFRHKQRGQSLAETAIGFSVLLLLISGLLDLGRIYYVFIALEDGAGEAAIYMSINPDCWDPKGFDRSSFPQDETPNADSAYADSVDYDDTGDTDCDDPNNGLWRATNSGGGSGSTSVVDWSSTDIQIEMSNTDGTNDGSIGDTITVSIYYDFEFLTPIMPKIAGVNPFTLKATASQTIIMD